MGTQIALPVVVGLFILAGLVASFLFWATRQADQVAFDHQRRLVSTILATSIAGIAHDQEAATVWDDAVVHTQSPIPDGEWLDANMGIWLHSYYGHDEVYIVASDGRPIYAMMNGKRAAQTVYSRRIAPVVRPLIEELRQRMRNPSPKDVSAMVLTPGAVDLTYIGGHPAIVSVKPIVPESDRIRISAGSEYVHISVRWLDGSFAEKLATQYDIEGARLLQRPDAVAGEAMIPLISPRTGPIAYLAWRPFAPGSAVLGRIAPALAVALSLVAIVMMVLIRYIRRSAMRIEASEAQAQHLAFHDPLTGLANRARFEDRLDRALAAPRLGTHAPALLFLDLDRFKTVNDTLGHPAGDELIRELGRRLLAIAGESDTVARLGGDEFAYIQTSAASLADTKALCSRIIDEVGSPFDLIGNKITVGVSIGVAAADGADRSELSRRADIALYKAKANGRGRFVVFKPSMDDGIRLRGTIEQQLRVALSAGDQFRVEYQPVFSARSLRIAGAEALIRWLHPVQGRMTPATFVPIAEETGLIEPMGQWVLEEACRTAIAWPIETLSVNISGVQLRNPAFADKVLAILAATGFPAHRLELEITETCFIQNARLCQPNIAALRSRGIRFALDDFGTGYSSFAHLREFDVDRLKIDRSFVNGIDGTQGGSAIIRAIVDLARAGGMAVTAEGVESRAQCEFLSEAGCDLLQGFLLSHPLSVEAFAALLDQQAAAAAIAA